MSAGAFKPKLTAMQLRIEALPASMETKLVLPDDVQFKQLPTKWQEEIFCEKLAASTTVAILDLAGVGLKDEFCTAFAEHVLKAGTQLREINLSRNEFSGAGITAIAEALAGTAVQKIKLNNQKKSLSADAEVRPPRTQCRLLHVEPHPWICARVQVRMRARACARLFACARARVRVRVCACACVCCLPPNAIR